MGERKKEERESSCMKFYRFDTNAKKKFVEKKLRQFILIYLFFIFYFTCFSFDGWNEISKFSQCDNILSHNPDKGH